MITMMVVVLLLKTNVCKASINYVCFFCFFLFLFVCICSYLQKKKKEKTQISSTVQSYLLV